MVKRYAKQKVVTRDVTKADVDRILATLTPQFNAKSVAKQDKERAASKKKYEKATAAALKRMDKKSEKRAKESPYKPAAGADAKGGKTVRGGTRGENLRPDTRKAVDSAARSKAEIQKLGGKPEEKQGLFTKIIDNLSRANYGVANAIEDAAAEFQQSRYEKQGVLGSLKDAIAETDEGFGAGASLKKKTTFSKVIQNNADRAAAKKAGRAPNQAIANEGKVNPLLKYGAGFVADVGLDPTTYMGLGIVKTAVGKSDDVVRMVEDVVKAEKKIASTGVKGVKATDPRLSSRTIPVEQLKRRDKARLAANPETKAVLDEALAFRKEVGASGVSRARRKGMGAHLLTPTAGKTSTVLKDFEGLANDAYNLSVTTVKKEAADAVAKRMPPPKTYEDFRKEGLTGNEAKKAVKAERTAYAKAVAEEYGKRIEKVPFQSADEITELLTATVAKNLSPEANKAFALRIGGKKIAEPLGLATALGKAAQRVGSVPHVAKSVERFNKTLNANYRISGAIRPFRNQRMGSGGNAIRAEAEELKAVWDGISKSERRQLANSIRSLSTAGSTLKGGRSLKNGGPVDNLGEYFLKEISDLQRSVAALGLKENQINAMLAGKFTLDEGALTFVEKARIKTHADGTSQKVIESSRFNDNFLMDKFLGGSFEDPAEFLYRYKVAVQNAAAHDAMNKTIASTHGVPLRKGQAAGSTGTASLANRAAQELVKKGWTTPRVLDSAGKATNKTVPGMEGYIFEPEIAESISRLNNVFFSENSRKEFVRTIDGITTGFKAMVTKYVPAFHVRTVISEAMLGQLGGMKNLPGSYAKAMKVQQGADANFMGLASPQPGLSRSQTQAANALNNAGSPVGAGRLGSRLPGLAEGNGSKVIIRHPKFGSINADQIRAYYNTSGLKSGFAATDMQRLDPSKHIAGRAGQAVSNTADTVMQTIEDTGRLAHFIDVLQYSKAKTLDEAVDEATEIVLKYHLDYSAVTPFEKNVATRVMPFYKWLRLSIPLMAEHLLTQPGKVLVVPKALQAASGLTGYDATSRTVAPGNPDDVIPEWIRDAGAMPIGGLPGGIFGNNTNYFDPTGTFPLSSLSEPSDPSNLTNMLTPIIGIPADLKHDKNKFGPAPSNEAAGIPGLPWLASQSPQTNVVRKLLSKPDPNNPEDTRTGDPDIKRAQILFDFLANPGLRANTQNRMASQAKTDQQEASAALKELKKKLGIVDK